MCETPFGKAGRIRDAIWGDLRRKKKMLGGYLTERRFIKIQGKGDKKGPRLETNIGLTE